MDFKDRKVFTTINREKGIRYLRCRICGEDTAALVAEFGPHIAPETVNHAQWDHMEAHGLKAVRS